MWFRSIVYNSIYQPCFSLSLSLSSNFHEPCIIHLLLLYLIWSLRPLSVSSVQTLGRPWYVKNISWQVTLVAKGLTSINSYDHLATPYEYSFVPKYLSNDYCCDLDDYRQPSIDFRDRLLSLGDILFLCRASFKIVDGTRRVGVDFQGDGDRFVLPRREIEVSACEKTRAVCPRPAARQWLDRRAPCHSLFESLTQCRAYARLHVALSLFLSRVSTPIDRTFRERKGERYTINAYRVYPLSGGNFIFKRVQRLDSERASLDLLAKASLSATSHRVSRYFAIFLTSRQYRAWEIAWTNDIETNASFRRGIWNEQTLASFLPKARFLRRGFFWRDASDICTRNKI